MYSNYNSRDTGTTSIQGKKYLKLENSSVIPIQWLACMLPKQDAEVLFFQFAYGLTLTMEGDRNRKVSMGIEKRVKMFSNRELQLK